MRCSIPRCRAEVRKPNPFKATRAVSPSPLCDVHRQRYQKAYAKRWKDHSMFGEEKRFASWFATWVQNVDEEMLNELVAPPEPPKSSYLSFEKVPLPEHATQAGQVAIAKRDKEQAALEAELKSDIAAYAKGRRMELEHELRMKREAEKRKRKTL